MPALDVCVLHDPDLGVLSLDCLNGYVVASYNFGHPAPRANVNDRYGGDGQVDLTRYSGPRTVQLSVTLDGNVRSFSRLRDRLTAYLQPDRRPELWVREPGDDRTRRLQLRGTNSAFAVSYPKINAMTVAWVAPTGLIESIAPKVVTVRPSSTETGRTYPRVYDRVYTSVSGGGGGAGSSYLLTEGGDVLTTEGGDPLTTEDSVAGGPAAGGSSGSPLASNAGTKAAQWTARLYGMLRNPVLVVGGKRLHFTAGTGLTIVSGQVIVVESQGKQVYYDDGVDTPALQFLDFPISDWGLIAGGNGDDPGTTTVAMTADEYDTAGRIELTYYDTWS